MSRSVLSAIAFSVLLWPIGAFAQSSDVVAQATPTPPPQNAFDNKWHASITPYLWAPGISGTLVFRHPLLPGAIVGADKEASINVSTGPSNYLSFIDSGALVAGEVRKNAFDIAADVIFLNFSNNGTANVTITGPGGKVEVPLTADVGWHLNQTMWELEPGLMFAHGDDGDAIVFTGVRSVSLKASASWSFSGPIDLIPLTGSDSESVTVTDVLGGIRGRVNIGPRWFVPLYQDIGFGSQTTTTQFYGGIGYAEHWGNLLLFYRQLYFDQPGANARARGLELNGMTLGATINL